MDLILLAVSIIAIIIIAIYGLIRFYKAKQNEIVPSIPIKEQTWEPITFTTEYYFSEKDINNMRDLTVEKYLEKLLKPKIFKSLLNQIIPFIDINIKKDPMPRWPKITDIKKITMKLKILKRIENEIKPHHTS